MVQYPNNTMLAQVTSNTKWTSIPRSFSNKTTSHQDLLHGEVETIQQHLLQRLDLHPYQQLLGVYVFVEQTNEKVLTHSFQIASAVIAVVLSRTIMFQDNL